MSLYLRDVGTVYLYIILSMTWLIVDGGMTRAKTIFKETLLIYIHKYRLLQEFFFTFKPYLIHMIENFKSQ